MKKIHIIKFILFFICFNQTFYIFAENPNYTVISSEERIKDLNSIIEENLEGTTVLQIFKEDQKIWELYKKTHIEMLFPEDINNVKMLWGSVSNNEIGEIILFINIERIKTLEMYLNRNAESGTDGRGDFKEYIEELKRMQLE